MLYTVSHKSEYTPHHGSTVRAFHSHLRLKIDVCELENVFRSMSANKIQNSLTYTVANNKRINFFSLNEPHMITEL